MAEQSSSGGATPWLAFLVGGLIVVVAIIAWFMYSGGQAPTKAVNVDVDVPTVEAPKLPDAPAIPKPG